jgi:hypothetical protein
MPAAPPPASASAAARRAARVRAPPQLGRLRGGAFAPLAFDVAASTALDFETCAPRLLPPCAPPARGLLPARERPTLRHTQCLQAANARPPRRASALVQLQPRPALWPVSSKPCARPGSPRAPPDLHHPSALPTLTPPLPLVLSAAWHAACPSTNRRTTPNNVLLSTPSACTNAKLPLPGPTSPRARGRAPLPPCPLGPLAPGPFGPFAPCPLRLSHFAPCPLAPSPLASPP